MPILLISLLIFTSACLHIRAEYKGPRSHVYFLKPLTTSLIIVLALYLANFDAAYAWLIIAGLLLSLFGDVFLMVEKYFLHGLISFLIAHLFYIGAFTHNMPMEYIFYWPALLPFLLFGVLVLAYLYGGLKGFRLPVIVYLCVIVVMGWQAANHWLTFPGLFSLFAALGAFIFMISDSLIAINQFKKPLRHARFAIMSTYYFAQWLIALSLIPFMEGSY